MLTSVTLAMLLGWATTASAAPGWTVVPTVDPSAGTNVLNGVAVRSSSDAWAVGQFTAPDQDDDGLNMLTERWNGSRWSQVRAPAVLHQDESLLAVSASSAGDAWAVGFTKTVGAAGRFPLAVQWNGSAWAIVPTPTLTGGSKSTLNGVVAIGPADAWAVGRGRNGAALAEHWNGSAWSIVASPSPASNDTLAGVAARSATDIWAVGTRQDRSGAIPIDRTLTEHWNGTAWSVVASPNVGGNDNLLNGVAATAGDIWAVGSSDVFAHTLALRETG